MGVDVLPTLVEGHDACAEGKAKTAPPTPGESAILDT